LKSLARRQVASRRRTDRRKLEALSCANATQVDVAKKSAMASRQRSRSDIIKPLTRTVGFEDAAMETDRNETTSGGEAGQARKLAITFTSDEHTTRQAQLRDQAACRRQN